MIILVVGGGNEQGKHVQLKFLHNVREQLSERSTVIVSTLSNECRVEDMTVNRIGSEAFLETSRLFIELEELTKEGVLSLVVTIARVSVSDGFLSSHGHTL